MDKHRHPGECFYEYANGNWIRNNPVPADKTRWGAFDQLQERNWFLVKKILSDVSLATNFAGANAQKVADFYKSAMDTNRLEKVRFTPLNSDLERIEGLSSKKDLVRFFGYAHDHGIPVGFSRGVSPDARNSGFYALQLRQGGLGLPDRDYYFDPQFSKQKDAYERHVARVLALLGATQAQAVREASAVIDLETSLARASKNRTDLRDPIANYHKFKVAEVSAFEPDAPLRDYLAACGIEQVQEVVVGQPEFFQQLVEMYNQRPVADWKAYLKFHLVSAAAPYLHAEAEAENFDFYGRVLRDQQTLEPRWQRAAKMIDAGIGEALGELFVERHFPPEARVRMGELVADIKSVFKDRLASLEWMTDSTRQRALAKFDRFTAKIGHPEKFRDYSAVEIRSDDLLGNVRRAKLFESRRQLARIGRPVDRAEWHMTPQTVNAYFNPFQNEIVFPAGILQPPFFDMEADDAVNYGAIGMVIGHEITHGFDDKGRKYDADGNLNEWWTPRDSDAFEERAEKLVTQYGGYEALPGLKLNGRLTLGENIADLGGASMAYEALQRALAREPSKRRKIDGFTPEQRFFLALAQLWRTNIKEEELRRRVTVDPHSPGRFRAFGPHVNLQEFFDAFNIREGDKLWRSPEVRAKIW